MSEITFEGVAKVYPGGTRAIHDVDLEIADGEFVVLVGPSGCVPPKDRDIAMVFQNYALYPHMTVFDNMAFGLKLRKMDKSEIQRRVDEAAQVLEITDFLDRKPKALSGGQRQRVAMGRAIVREPAAFLMDEPLSNLDAKLRVQMRSELGELHTRLKTTTLYVTHDQVEAMTMGDRVAVLKAISGKEVPNLAQVDTPRVLFDRPDNLFVAGFIGSPAMNFVYGTVAAQNGSTFVTFGSDRLGLDRATLDARPGLANYAGKEIVVGLRPGGFEIDRAVTGGFSEDHTMMVDVGLVEQLGSEAYIHFEKHLPPVITPDIQDLLADQGQGPETLGDRTKFTARVNPDFAPKFGDQAKLVIDTTKLHFFDKDTGNAIR